VQQSQVFTRLDRAVDEQVPEEYRDTARSLLDLLRSGGNQPPPKKSP